MLLACGLGRTSEMDKSKEVDKMVYKPKDAVYSGNHVVIITEEPFIEISLEKRKELMDTLSSTYPSNEIEISNFDNPYFVDAGGYFESVHCNLCGSEISMDDWTTKMEEASWVDFSSLTFETPCCGKQNSLNLLNYKPNVGFSKLQVRIVNLDYHENQAMELLNKVEAVLKIQMKVFYYNH